MKKIPTIYRRELDGKRRITFEPHPDCRWVFNGEGVARRKYDGTCCRVKNGELWKRREVKKGKPIPDGFEPVDHDEATGKTVGWVPVTDAPEDRWHREAFGDGATFPDRTYELCGPRINGNPEDFRFHVLVPHAEAGIYCDAPRTYHGLSAFLEDLNIEGLVFVHPDGRMGKIKKRDYGLKRK